MSVLFLQRTRVARVSVPTVVERYRGEVHATYRYLRLAIILLTVLLGCAVGIQVLGDGGTVLPSVSAYYYSPARAVFVSSLCAIGACMIVHRGRSDLEDVLLNFSGYLAFFVAFVPTPSVVIAGTDAAAQAPRDLTDAVSNNTGAILIVGLIAFVVEIFVVPRRERSFRGRAGRTAHVASAIAFAGLGVFFLVARDEFIQRAHTIAAAGLFIGIVGVVGVNGVALARAARERGESRRAQVWNRYTIGFLVMIGSVVAVVTVARPMVAQWVFVLETALIAQFLLFWIVQTVERWRVPEPPQDDLVPG
ncbi:hypothetical protein [Microbacterium sp.]|uniref:hypothetical protein n=1 Tax=Microbacterium sp. TaxID=51671 RepID=UPI003A8AB435